MTINFDNTKTHVGVFVMLRKKIFIVLQLFLYVMIVYIKKPGQWV